MTAQTSRLAPEPCPNCGKELDAATGMGHSGGPSPGDVTVCLYCTAILEFDSNLRRVALTPEQIVELPAEVRGTLRRVIEAIRKVNPPKGKP